MGLYLSPWDVNSEYYGYKDKDGKKLVGADGQPLNGKTWDQVKQEDALDYNEYYDNQLKEILGNDKYGNNGHFKEVWMDGAKDTNDKSNAQDYDFQRWFKTIQQYEGKASGKYEDDCLLFGAESYTTVRWIGNERGYAAEETWQSQQSTERIIRSIVTVETDIRKDFRMEISGLCRRRIQRLRQAGSGEKARKRLFRWSSLQVFISDRLDTTLHCY